MIVLTYMCVACGLPSTHTSTIQTLAVVSTISFGLTTFVGAWLILTHIKFKRLLRRLLDRLF